MGRKPVVKLSAISKRFGGVHALRDVDFDMFPGEVHVLLGENGAGKSTLVKILSGVERPDAGTVEVGGVPTQFAHPSEARRLGIATVFQEFSLAPDLSVAENLLLPHVPTRRFGLVDRRRLLQEAARVLDTLGADIDPSVPVRQLSVAQRQLVEIGRALVGRASVLIMDEPTAALSKGEIDQLFQTVRRLKQGGVAILYISHRLEEVHELGDRVTVLRDGRRVATMQIDEASVPELIRMMIGREIRTLPGGPARRSAPVIVDVRGVSREPFFRNVSLSVRAGQIVGIAGLVGSGGIELTHSLFGDPPPEQGQVVLHGRAFEPRSPRASIRQGVAFIPEDRARDGLVSLAPIVHNLTLPQLDRFSRFGVLSLREESRSARQLVQRLGVVAPGVHVPCESLSGGNQQKVVVGKWMRPGLKLLLVNEPTRGVDVAAREEIYGVFRELAAEGVAVLLVSSDFEEVVRLSHEVLVMRSGQIVGRLAAEDATHERLLALAIQGEVA